MDKEKLRALLKTFKQDLEEPKKMVLGDYNYLKSSEDLSFLDFNKEIIEPGELDWTPDGAIGIRVDDDFWIVAFLPYEFNIFSIQELVELLWPDIYSEAEFHPDSRDHGTCPPKTGG